MFFKLPRFCFFCTDMKAEKGSLIFFSIQIYLCFHLLQTFMGLFYFCQVDSSNFKLEYTSFEDNLILQVKSQVVILCSFCKFQGSKLYYRVGWNLCPCVSSTYPLHTMSNLGNSYYFRMIILW